jgi:hypothetical protein
MDNEQTRNDGSNHDPKQIVNKILQTALNIHHERENVYGGKTSQNVFNDCAIICSIILRKDLDSKDIAMIFTVMKLARYGNILELMEHFRDNPEEFAKLEKSIYDSALDGMVYMAITERERDRINSLPEGY